MPSGKICTYIEMLNINEDICASEQSVAIKAFAKVEDRLKVCDAVNFSIDAQNKLRYVSP